MQGLLRYLGVSLFLIALMPSVGVGSYSAAFFLAATDVDDGVLPLADVYALPIANYSQQDIIRIRMDLRSSRLGLSRFLVSEGGYLFPSDLEAANNTLPAFRGVPITDSFIVLPSEGGLLSVDPGGVFSSDRIAVDYQSAGHLVRGSSSRVIAHISVPAGELLMNDYTAFEVVYRDGSIGEYLIPEPGASVLVGLPIFLAAFRREAR